MVKKRVDPRVRGMIIDGVRKNHRSLVIIVGDHGKDQVENLHKILSKQRVRARPSVLWCYKKELGFSTHRKKRINEIKRDKSRGLYDAERDDPFELFIGSTDIRWTYYKETDKILGQTFGMCVLQDFEALTPNILARTIETVEGGGLVVLLMKTVKSLKQLYSMTMDVHSRFRTEAHHEVVPRFNERFILSLGDCQRCLVLDDELNILPLSSHADDIPTFEGEGGLHEGDADASGYVEDPELTELKSSLEDTPCAGNLVHLTKTLDQGKAVLSFLDAISEKTLRATVALTAARGRGKSAAIGLCLAGAVSYGYSNIFVTAPSPENLKTVFEFVIMGLKALKYSEHADFEVLQEHHGDAGKVVIRINVFKDHRQTIQYILPTDHSKLAQAELVAIDEAAAIPLPVVKKLMGPYLVFISSTVNGYEGTGRSLSLKLIQQLRMQQGQAMTEAANKAAGGIVGAKSGKGERKVHEERWKVASEAAAATKATSGRRLLTEISLDIPIRYSQGDNIEKWLNNLLCLDVTTHSTRIVNVMPAPKDCELFIVNRDALFSYHALSESFLQKIWALYTSAHYKNTPNDLQMLSDAPAHRLFVLLGPQNTKSSAIPDILCVVQVAFEGFISQQTVHAELAKNNKASGDLIPWTISQQFSDTEFATLSGVRIVRIATHPDVQSMGYGSRAIDLICEYFQGNISRTNVPEVGIFGGEGGADVEGRPTTSAGGKVGGASGGGASASAEPDLLNEEIKIRAKLPPLLTPIADRPAERLHYIGVSFGLTTQLANFWTRKGFKVCYVRQTTNDLTGEHSCIVLKELDCSSIPNSPSNGWLNGYVQDYRRRLISLMSFSFSKIETALALSLADPDNLLTSQLSNDSEEVDSSDMMVMSSSSSASGGGSGNSSSSSSNRLAAYNAQSLSAEDLLKTITYYDLKRLDLYSRNMVDHHMIIDLLPTLANFLFLGRLPGLRLSHLQVAILLATGLQHRDVDDISTELNLPVSQVLAFFNKTVRKIALHLKNLVEKHTAAQMQTSDKAIHRLEARAKAMNALDQSLKDDQRGDEKDFKKLQENAVRKSNQLGEHSAGSLEALKSELSKKKGAIPSIISIPKAVSQSSGGGGSGSDEGDGSDGKRKRDDSDENNKKKLKRFRQKEKRKSNTSA